MTTKEEYNPFLALFCGSFVLIAIIIVYLTINGENIRCKYNNGYENVTIYNIEDGKDYCLYTTNNNGLKIFYGCDSGSKRINPSFFKGEYRSEWRSCQGVLTW